MVDEATPAMVHVVLKLPFVNMIMNFAANSLHPSALINLSKSALQIVPVTFHCVVAGCGAVPLDIYGVEYSQRFPLLNVFTQIGWDMKDRQDLIVAGFSFENFFKFRWEASCRKSCRALSD